MYGVLDSLGYGPVDARISNNSTMVKLIFKIIIYLIPNLCFYNVVLVLECQWKVSSNPVVYDLMSEMAFQHKKINVKKIKFGLLFNVRTVVQTWLDSYSRRRNGKLVPSIQEAWKILYHTLYNCKDVYLAR
uniref:Alpha-N-acetylglucosaminidase C-terminal domain-containing protein n=1 Tax=Lactuca sativa TaxID=4236 RepID=A0A9R1WJV3_LACSA|nr:hypothetical protein LSAT_V11C100048480 [Lactuca sativa]